MGGLCLALVSGGGCQTFRTERSEANKEADQKAGEVVGDTGTLFYYLCEFWPWMY